MKVGYTQKVKVLVKTSLVVSAMLALAACGGGASSDGASSDQSKNGETTSFKISHVTQESHVWHKTVEKFGEELETLSDGKMSVEIFPGSQLGLEKDMVQQLETGSLDFGFLTNAYMSTRQDSLNAWFMPFTFENLKEAAAMRESDAAKQMLEELDSQGLVGLDFMFAGNRHVLLKDGAVQSPDHLKGKKIRIIGSPAMQDFWQEVDAGPTAMPLSEVYTSLQTGVIDGIDIDLDALVTEKYYENAENLTLTNHMTFPTVVVMSKQVYEGLSEEDRKIVKEAMTNAVNWGVEEAIAREEKNLEELKKLGVKVEELKDPSLFDSTKKTITDKYEGESEVIKSFLEEVQK
ncbi:C4-dicarboxylate ABC transporter substrate-binding protein [Bacillus sp. VT-16-64]|uniref:TRAP transporter substrate-binding protein n=1 Tax=Siminovitchia thermophila TaxID=1245522 RepID=UPI00097D986C|nr:TRAP transporter substrate-binding protein [Siminovitchia thermophila]ONK22202.1 C4-dicarboxylate ABC transporter substrate-binding protein [Bacillus sp. VT-16-64]